MSARAGGTLPGRNRRTGTVSSRGCLEPLDLGAGLGQLRGDLQRDDADAVLVGVDQVAGADLDARELDGLAEVDQPDIGVAHARVQPEELEAQRVDLVEVAGAAAGDVADAAELLVDRRVHLAELGAQAGRVVQVLAHGDLRTRLRGHVAEIVAE